MSKKKLLKLKQRANVGDVDAMYEYGMETDDSKEQKEYLKMTADNGYEPARQQLENNGV